MVERAVVRAPESAAGLPPLGVGEARSGAVQPPVHLGIVGGHRPDIGGSNHRSSPRVRFRQRLCLLPSSRRFMGQARIACTGRRPWGEGHEEKAMKAVLFAKHGGGRAVSPVPPAPPPPRPPPRS